MFELQIAKVETDDRDCGAGSGSSLQYEQVLAAPNHRPG